MSTSRVRLLLMVAVALAMLVDFSRRIYVPRDVQPRDAGSFVPADVPAPLSVAEVSRDLARWLPGLQPVAAGTGSVEETGWTLTLLAVFSEPDAPFAVIRATPAAGGAAKVQRIVEGDELYGFKVVRIEPQRVRLEGVAGEQELQAFKPAGSTVAGSGKAAVVDGAPAATPAGPGAVTPPSAAPTVVRAAPTPTPAQPSAVPRASTAPVAGPQQVAPTELQSGQAFELPPSMRGMKVVEAPIPPQKSDADAKPARREPPPAPQKP